MATTVTTKGQVTIPRAVRASLGIHPGDAVTFERNARGEFVLEKVGRTEGPDRFDRARGAAGPGPTTEEVMRLLRADDGV